jgi:hypothetical protein
MSIDITGLDLLPETDGESEVGLMRCAITCWFTCFGPTCHITGL